MPNLKKATFNLKSASKPFTMGKRTSKMDSSCSDGMSYVRRRTGERFKDECVQRTVKQGGSRMVWGCFSYHGLGQLALLDGTVNGTKYQEILETNLIPSIENHFSRADVLIFQDDSAPCHRAKIVSINFFVQLEFIAIILITNFTLVLSSFFQVKNYLSKIGVSSLEWPGNSPDLNPIENLWFVMKAQVAQKRPKTLSELDRILEEVWYNGIAAGTLKNLINSMPERVKAVIKSRGGSTKY